MSNWQQKRRREARKNRRAWESKHPSDPKFAEKAPKRVIKLVPALDPSEVLEGPENAVQDGIGANLGVVGSTKKYSKATNKKLWHTDLTVPELRAQAKSLQLRNYSKAKRADLIAMIEGFEDD